MENKSTSSIIECPHCKEFVWIGQLNCRIFRHASFKTGEQIPPHSTQQECETWLQQDLLYGCAKPFQILESGEVIQCDYI
jgi:hypothetical protein